MWRPGLLHVSVPRLPSIARKWCYRSNVDIHKPVQETALSDTIQENMKNAPIRIATRKQKAAAQTRHTSFRHEDELDAEDMI